MSEAEIITKVVPVSAQEKNTAAVIIQLKEIKKELDLSNQDIFDMVQDAGGYVSLSSVKRVFADGSENQGFRYKDTIQPISRVLLGVKPQATMEAAAEDNQQVAQSQLDALKSVSLIKDELIDELQYENEAIRKQLYRAQSELTTQADTLRAESKAKVDYLKEDVKRKNKIIAILAVALSVILVAIIVLLVADRLNPTWGYFRTSLLNANAFSPTNAFKTL